MTGEDEEELARRLYQSVPIQADVWNDGEGRRATETEAKDAFEGEYGILFLEWQPVDDVFYIYVGGLPWQGSCFGIGDNNVMINLPDRRLRLWAESP